MINGHLVYVFNGHLVYFEVIFGIFFPVLVCCTKENLATLAITRSDAVSHVLNFLSSFLPLAFFNPLSPTCPFTSLTPPPPTPLWSSFRPMRKRTTTC
jgi:hypothetical protein